MVMFAFNFVQFFLARQAEFSERIVMSGERIRTNLFMLNLSNELIFTCAMASARIYSRVFVA